MPSYRALQFLWKGCTTLPVRIGNSFSKYWMCYAIVMMAFSHTDFFFPLCNYVFLLFHSSKERIYGFTRSGDGRCYTVLWGHSSKRSDLYNGLQLGHGRAFNIFNTGRILLTRPPKGSTRAFTYISRKYHLFNKGWELSNSQGTVLYRKCFCV